MNKILVPFDGSDSAIRAVRYAATLVGSNTTRRLELLYVANSMPIGTHGTLSQDQVNERAAAETETTVQAARRILDDAGIAYQVHTRLGSAASEITKYAEESGCDGIVMGTRGMGPVASAMIGSVATKVVTQVDVPVTLIK
ncbi:MAG TPA: universal stress protein [Noviherbaspirillum sp.]|jgi:nucleotide-binding universal stress UspA family protein|uniref:universal stress protein n=1 Tax=Noviherbaspirillum sp. TaxID=1926288 RepID=UPI002DDCE1C0|nr:universal stress protein [Noviherbaspirillum sp.]HEV2609470.1 universal stress protein [Noviherbaspirillum sp.]